jgi:hypothetical protein
MADGHPLFMIGKVLGHRQARTLKGTPTSPPTRFALWRTGRLPELSPL